jgi:hypothetical protein
MITNGLSIGSSGSGGLISIDGELFNLGSIQAASSGSTISILYSASHLTANNLTINTTGANGTLNLTNDTVSADNGSLLSIGAGTSGSVYISTANTFNLSGNAWNVNASSLSILSGGTLSLAGAFNSTVLSASIAGNTANFTQTTGSLSVAAFTANAASAVTSLVASAGNISLTTATIGSSLYVSTSNRLSIIGTITGNAASTMTFIGDTFELPSGASIDASSTGSVSIAPNSNKSISIAGSTDQADTTGGAGLFDVSNPEFARITSGNLTIGSTGISSSISVGSINLTSTLNIITTGNFTGGTLNLGSNSLFISATNITTGSISAASVNISASGSVTSNQAISVTGSLLLSTSSMSINANITSNTGFISTSSGIVQTLGVITANSLEIVSSSGGLGSSSNNLSLSVNTLSTSALSAYIHNTGNLELAGNSNSGVFSITTTGNMTISNAITGSSIYVGATGSILSNAAISASSASTALVADSDNTGGTDFLTLNHSVYGSTVLLRGAGILVNSSGSVSASVLSIQASGNKSILMSNGLENDDTASIFDLATIERNRMMASTVRIGGSGYSGNISITSITLSSQNMSLSTAGTFSNTSLDISNNQFSALANSISSGSISGSTGQISLNSTSSFNLNTPLVFSGSGRIILSSSASLGLNTNLGNSLNSISLSAGTGISQGLGLLVRGSSLGFSSTNNDIGSSSSYISVSTPLLSASAALGSVFIHNNQALTFLGGSAGGGYNLSNIGNLTLAGLMTGNTINVSIQGNVVNALSGLNISTNNGGALLASGSLASGPLSVFIGSGSLSISFNGSWSINSLGGGSISGNNRELLQNSSVAQLLNLHRESSLAVQEQKNILANRLIETSDKLSSTRYQITEKLDSAKNEWTLTPVKLMLWLDENNSFSQPKACPIDQEGQALPILTIKDQFDSPPHSKI